MRMLGNDASFFEIHLSKHHAVTCDQPPLEHVGYPFFLHRVPAVERAFVFRRHALRILYAQGMPPRSNTTRPPTIVYMIRASRIVSGGIRVRSRSMITTSASLPGTSDPFSCSSNDAYAPPVV